MGIGAFAVAVVDDRHLRGEARDWHILAIQVHDRHVVAAQRLPQVVEPAVGILLDAAKHGQVILVEVVLAIAEQANPELIVLKKEAAKIRGEGLNTDAQAVEIVAVGHVAQVLVDERGLNADEIIVTRLAGIGVDVQLLQFADRGMIEIEHGREAEFEVGRLEGGVAFV